MKTRYFASSGPAMPDYTATWHHGRPPRSSVAPCHAVASKSPRGAVCQATTACTVDSPLMRAVALRGDPTRGFFAPGGGAGPDFSNTIGFSRRPARGVPHLSVLRSISSATQPSEPLIGRGDNLAAALLKNSGCGCCTNAVCVPQNSRDLCSMLCGDPRLSPSCGSWLSP